MKEKTVRIKLRKITSGGVGGRVYKIETVTNAVEINTGFVNYRHVGDEISESEAEFLCRERHTEVLVT